MMPRGRGRWALALLALAVLVTLLGYFAWSRGERRRAIADLTPAERRVAFDSSLASYKELCVGRSTAALDAYCREQRAVIRMFPECDGACRELLEKSEPGPTR